MSLCMGKNKKKQEREEDDLDLFDKPIQCCIPLLDEPKEKKKEAKVVSGGEVRLEVKEYLALLDSIKIFKKSKPPQTFLVREIQLRGETKGKEEHCAVFSISFCIQQLYNEWSCIPLLPTTIVVIDTKVSCTITNEEEEPSSAFLGVFDDRHCLYAQSPASYEVQMKVKVPFISHRGQGIEITLPKAVKNSLQFTVHQQELEITAVPSLGGTVDTGTPGTKKTTLLCDVPPTNILNIQWKEKIEDEMPVEVIEQEKQVIVNVEQFTTHSIGEGIVQSTTELHYKILHGSRSSFELLVPCFTRVLSIDGEAVKRWDMVNEKKQESESENREEGFIFDVEDNEKLKTLKVWLDYGIENTYQLIVLSETDMESTSCDVIMPGFSCKDVNREKGFLAIEARTNVEVSEIEQQNLARIGFIELPSNMKSNSVHPPLLSYKFLLSDIILLKVNVNKHEDAEVLIASIESAHLQATLSQDKVLYHFIMTVRNTQTQYVRVRLPPNSSVWSSFVGANAVKPAMDEEGCVMVPLQKSRSNNHAACVVELVYLTILPSPIGTKGTLSLHVCPDVDIPINHMFTTVKLPSNYAYSEFRGSMQETRHFSVAPPASMESQDIQNVPSLHSNVFLQQQMVPSKRNRKQKGGKLSVSGLLPVKIQMPSSGGISFYFEKLLVINESFEVSVDYKRNKQQTRSIHGRSWQTPFFLLLFICFLFYYYFY